MFLIYDGEVILKIWHEKCVFYVWKERLVITEFSYLDRSDVFGMMMMMINNPRHWWAGRSW
jgi:hypothetical protein